MESFGHVIAGEEVASADGTTFESVDPWTREPWATVALGSADDAERAVRAARSAFDEGPWPRMSFTERGAILHRLADLLEKHSEELAAADTADMGKPITQTRGHDVPRAARNFRFFADHAQLTPAETFPMPTGHHAYTEYDPAGVVAAIAPWNFPLMMASWKVAPALAWGNTVVLKPAEQSPASATILARLAIEAGLPPGVLNVVHGFGPNSVGQALTESPLVDRITFTGESATGRLISRAAAANLTPVSLELGGKGANIVFADADLDQAVRWSIQAVFSNSGQVCLAGSRLYVQRQVYDEFLARFTAAAEALVLGDPKDPATQIGPLSSREHFTKVAGYLDIATAAGARLHTGGVGEGWTVRPTVVVGAGQRDRVTQEEIFGPVVVVLPFDDEADAVAAANDTPYGLNAMLFTQDLSRAHRVARALRVGTVWTNCFFVRDLRAPFGGAKDSGVGREGGTYSREFFTEPKAVIMEIS
ncbi:aldehyde dehydrogenase [Microbispora rosea subsp. aerata]|nr:aldehyde dehydrogenase [Microbispora rosea]GGO22529.1 aldehyde dehydrogenase [Microbispora rosea subsp. aerata]GIH57427.1 aldehyde dehydrogenase [Microbispora rosea subsp. aerata]GLJ86378.1 aldehyde dehydrogenase [Microbispora rosea subsp. aerata]